MIIMRKYYTIEKTLHTDKKSLVAMITCCLGNVKNPTCDNSNIKNSNSEKNFLGGQESSKKKISSPSL